MKKDASLRLGEQRNIYIYFRKRRKYECFLSFFRCIYTRVSRIYFATFFFSKLFEAVNYFWSIYNLNVFIEIALKKKIRIFVPRYERDSNGRANSIEITK